jgi:hypothetical protein
MRNPQLITLALLGGANDKIFYGKDGVLTGADRQHAEVSMLALHLLQSSLVHVNIQLIQAVLRDPAWAERLTAEDRRGLSPLFWTHINPYGRFYLDMNTRLDLSTARRLAAQVCRRAYAHSIVDWRAR